MNKQSAILVWFFCFLLSGSYAQLSDTTHSLLQDQNPNHQKSKEKYVKTLPVPVKEKPATPVIIDSPKVSIPTGTVGISNNTEPEIFFKNLKTARENHNAIAEADALSALGSYYLKTNDLVTASDYYQKALLINQKLQNNKALVENHNQLGTIYFRQKNTTKAEEAYQQALMLARMLNNSYYIRQASDALSRIFATKGNYKNAYEMSLLLKQVTDSLSQNETKQKLLQARLSYDSLQQIEKTATYQKGILQKQAEIESSKKITYLIAAGMALALLLAFSFYRSYQNTKKSNKKIALQQKETEEKKEIIESSLKEKEILLKEIHHRVKNNLQIVSSLLNLQANRTNSEELKKTINEAKNRISSMALLHQKIYQSGNLSSIDFQAYIEQMVQSMEAGFNTSKKDITYTIQTNGIILDIDTSIPLGLIINELLTNSYKYAFTDQASGAINIILNKKNAEDMELHISDNGKGFPPDFDVSTLNSLGLKLVKGLSNQLKGTIRFENNNGAHSYITFKNPLVN